MIDLHHVHLFASDLDASVAWWREMLGAEVAFDGTFGGARNVFLRVGRGRLHLYDQPPREGAGDAIHHVGIRVNDLAGLVARMKAGGIAFRNDIREFGWWRYVMCPAPDGVLLELFEIDAAHAPDGRIREYFGGDAPRRPL
jgi:catechol 2,3-dioxygenase-like lactoylglutathione lyase family enzyme